MTTPTTATGLRTHLYAPVNTWIPELNNLLTELSPDHLSDWNVNDRIYDRPRFPNHTDDERYSHIPRYTYPSDSIQFVYKKDDSKQQRWLNHTNHFWVSYSSRWEPEFAPDDYTPPAQHWRSTTRPAQYLIGGLLADTYATTDLNEAVDHITTQFTEIKERYTYLEDLERVATIAIDNELTENDTPTELPELNTYTPDDYFLSTYTNPVGTSGIGADTIEGLANAYGAHTNILLHSENEFYDYLSTAYGNSPDIDGALNQLAAAQSLYNTYHKTGETNTALTPEDLHAYPQHQPKTFLGINYTPHTLWEDSP